MKKKALNIRLPLSLYNRLLSIKGKRTWQEFLDGLVPNEVPNYKEDMSGYIRYRRKKALEAAGLSEEELCPRCFGKWYSGLESFKLEQIILLEFVLYYFPKTLATFQITEQMLTERMIEHSIPMEGTFCPNCLAINSYPFVQMSDRLMPEIPLAILISEYKSRKVANAFQSPSLQDY